MKNSTLTILICLLLQISIAQPTLNVSVYVTGLSSPVDIANCGDERLFIVEQDGYIRIIDGLGNVKPTAFLDIASRVGCCGERGLLGLAFHPDYKNNGYFFVYYTNNSGNLVISRFNVTPGNPDLADASSETTVITIAHPTYANHNGGNLEFGPDGYLYIGVGDGGGGGNPNDSGQDPLSLLGKMLRLDVNTLPYQIPPDNPYYGFSSTRNEIWAMGLRNPWRFSFDRLTGDLWIGDVGQNAWEEIDFQPAASSGGENYGWRCYEGNHSYSSSGFGCSAAFTYPVFEYSHGSECSIDGGYVYRGCKYPNLFGHYILTDYCSGKFWTIQNNGGGNFQATTQFTFGNNYSSFGEDMNGEIYLAKLNGTIYRITETTATATLPAITATPGTSLCPGGTVNLSTQSGYASYDWTLDSSIPAGSGTQVPSNTPGSYTLTATGTNGCVYTTPATTIASVPAPAPVILAADTSFCETDSLQLSTGSFNAYQWSDSSNASAIFAKQGGTYDVTVTDANGCTGASLPFAVTEHPSPVPAIQQTGYLCNGNSATLSTDQYVSYLWSTSAPTQSITVGLPGNYDVTVTDYNGCFGSSLPFAVADNQLPKPIISSTNGSAFCEDDSTDLSASSTNVSLLWSTGDTAASIIVTQSGEYVVTATDSNGCIGVSDTFVISTFPIPSPFILPGNEITICDGDSVILSTDSSFTTYAWSSGETGHQIIVKNSGNYNVTIEDANSCIGISDSAGIEVAANPPIPVISASDTIFCEGDSVELTTGNFNSYQWSNGSTASSTFVVQGGLYDVTVVDTNECSSSSSPLAITENPLPVPTILHGNEVAVCDGDSVTLSTDVSYSAYSWSSGETNAQIIVSGADNYNVTVQDGNGCVGVSDSTEVVVHSNPPVPTIIEQTETPVLSVSELGHSYQWYLNGNIIPNVTGQSITYTDYATQGEFSVSITDSNGCTSLSDSISVLWSGIEETLFRDLSIKPNPFTSEIILTYTLNNAANLRIRLQELTGKEIGTILNEKQIAGSHTVTINANKFNLSEGIYFLKLEEGSLRRTFKIVKM